MAVHVTRCPHCQTSFRVRDEHLSVAKGMVRCGSCLQVFRAAEHFIDNPAPAKPVSTAKPAQPATPQKVVKPRPAPAPVEDDDDDFGLIHDDMEDDPIPETLADNPYTDFNLREPDKAKRPKPREDPGLDNDLYNLRNSSFETMDFLDIDEDEGKVADDESWADALIDDSDDKVNADSLQLKGNDEFNFDLPPPEDDDFQGDISDDDYSPRRQGYSLDGDKGVPSEAVEIALPAKKKPVARIKDEPLDLGQNRRRKIPWGWSVGVVLMLTLAAAQTLYFNFDEWARTPQWRPWYAKICDIAGCKLPKIQNIRDMATQNLVVRSHPTLQRALIVDTLLLNKASYEQPFPDFTLVFRDLNDNIVASRRFTPQQYLSGELSGQTDMPVQTPVHISLELVDPGPEAVSYSISLQSNQ